MAGSPSPDFFIVGGPKCGTTSLYHYLRRHPEVFMPARKEPHYFCPDLYSPRYVHDLDRYLALFRDGAGRKRIGEASVYYLYSRLAAQRIKAFAPQADIIIMLRNPVDMIHSLHSQRLYSGHEDIADFAEALAAEPDRRQGRRLPRHPHPIPVLFYREVGRLAGQVRRYLDTFGGDHVHVIIFEDLARDPGGTYGAVCRFLGIRTLIAPEFRVYNPNKTVRSRLLRTVLKFSPSAQRLARALVARPLRQRFARGLVRANTRFAPRPSMPEELRRGLQEEFSPDVQDLERLLGRDLSAWDAADERQEAQSSR